MLHKNHWPTLGIAGALGLLVAATRFYPGGTADSARTVGYSWAHNSVSALFQPVALNGTANPARSLAIPAMLLLCVSLGLLFRRIASQVPARTPKKTIEIAGIGTMVYGFLVVTPLHDLMVDLVLLFGLVALLTTMHVLYGARRWWLFAWGALGLALVLVSTIIYYGNVFSGWLPVVQKLSLLTCLGWLLTVYYRQRNQEKGKA